MKKPTLIIGLLGGGKHMGKEEGGLLEPEMEMPEALMDERLNKQNKAKAIIKAAYGPAEDKKMCGNCEYFETEYPELKKGEGFCEVWEFKCSEKNVCLAWEFSKPEDDYKGEE